MGKKTGDKNVFDLIEDFAGELIRNGIQKKKPKDISDIRNGRKKKHGKI
jgi:hypothetical protein